MYQQLVVLVDFSVAILGSAPNDLATFFQPSDGLMFRDHCGFVEDLLPPVGDESADVPRVAFEDLPRWVNSAGIYDKYFKGANGAKRHPVALGQLKALLQKQWNGEEGQLLVGGQSNLVHVLGCDGCTIFDVILHRQQGTWYIAHCRFGDPEEYRVGPRVLYNED